MMVISTNSFITTLLRVFSFFLAFYFVMMGIFTYMKVESIKTYYASTIGGFLPRISEEFTKNITDYYNAQHNDMSLPYEKSKENLITNLTTSMNLSIRTLTINKIYAKSGLFSENGQQVAKSGNMIRINESIKSNNTSSWGLYCYLDLDKFLSQDEIISLYDLKSSESSNKPYSIEVEGYKKESEIIPRKISIFEEEWNLTRKQTDTRVIKEFVFSPKNEGEFKKYSNIQAIRQLFFINDINISGMTTIKLDEKNLKRYRLCDDAFNFESIKPKVENVYRTPILLSSEEGINYVKQLIVLPFEASGSKYYLSLSSVYYPLEVAFPDLMIVYIFSLIMVMVLSTILAYKLWDIYQKQQKIEKNRRDMTNAIGHDLKTPLSIIRTYSEGLKEQIAENKRDHYLSVIIDETDKMDDMVLEMLDLSKLEAKAYELKIENVNMNNIVKGVLRNNEDLVRDKVIILEYSEDKEWIIEADTKRIEQVVTNLVSNAISFTREGGKIAVKLCEGKLLVENECEHLSDEKKKLIWNAFYKDDASRQRGRTGAGTGLGLSIVKNIVELHHMTYGVENIEGGVQFWIKFKN